MYVVVIRCASPIYVYGTQLHEMPRTDFKCTVLLKGSAAYEYTHSLPQGRQELLFPGILL